MLDYLIQNKEAPYGAFFIAKKISFFKYIISPE
jgi:hypothetical protein